MARKTIVELIDDLNGEKADETVIFGLDGITYEIDLTEENATALREDLSTWVNSARRVAGRKARGTGAASGSSSDTALIRDWARAQGYEVSSRGRIAQEIRDQYYAAH